MPRDRDATRRTILDRCYELFYRHGFNRVGVDEIAAAAGVTKRTLYNHFPSKDALLTAALEHQHELALARSRRWTSGLGGEAAAMIDVMFADLARWASKPGWSGTGFTRLALELADMKGHPARKVASRHKASIEARIADLLVEAGTTDPREKAREIVILLEGATALMVVHGDTVYARHAARAARKLLEA